VAEIASPSRSPTKEKRFASVHRSKKSFIRLLSRSSATSALSFSAITVSCV
jgi:hypothetical protein